MAIKVKSPLEFNFLNFDMNLVVVTNSGVTYSSLIIGLPLSRSS